MVRHEQLAVMVERLERALDQAVDMELEHLHFLLSMALVEARRQRPDAPVPLRLVVRNAGQG